MSIGPFSHAQLDRPPARFAAWLLAAALIGGGAAGEAAAGPAPASVPHGLLDDAPAPFVPKRPASEAERNRVDAVAMFAAGRAHQERQEYDAALRMYQRAFRLAPGARDIAQAVVALAYQLGRGDVAIRYLKWTDPADDDPAMLRDLGDRIFDRGDAAEAAALWERALAAEEPSMEPGKETAESEAVRLKLGLVYSEIEQNVALRLRLGHVYFDADKFAKAAEQFAPLLAAAIHTERLPDDKAKKALLREIGERCDEMGDCFLAAGRLSEAEAAFEKYNESTPNRAMLEFNRARVAAQSDKPAEALARLEKAFQSHIAAKGAVPYELLAKLLTKLGKEKELLERLEKLHAAEPTNVPLGCFLADRFRRAGELDKAESLYRGLLARSRSAAACEGLISLERKRRNADALLAAVGEAIDLPDEASEGVDVEEKAIVADAGLLRELVAAARKQLAAAPDKLDYRQRLAVALLALDAKQDDLAGEFFDLAIKVRPERTATLLKIWGRGLLEEDRFAEAARVFQRGIDAKPAAKDSLILHFYLSFALAQAGRIDEALAAARKAAELGKDMPQFCIRPAWILYQAKRYDEAIAAFAAVLARFDADIDDKTRKLRREAQSAIAKGDFQPLADLGLFEHSQDERFAPETRDVVHDARLALADLCILSNRIAEGEEWVEQVLDEYPEDAAALNELGYLWADQGVHLDRALEMIRKAVAAKPDEAAYRDSLGWVLYRLGRNAEAVAELQKAAAGKEPDGEILDHLGEALAKTGRADKAEAAWRRAAAAFRKAKDEKKAKQVEKKIHKKSA